MQAITTCVAWVWEFEALVGLEPFPEALAIAGGAFSRSIVPWLPIFKGRNVREWNSIS